MEKGISKFSWLGGKYLLSNFKKERKDILENSESLRRVYKTFLNKDVITKTYYDTPDFFFKRNGININVNEIRRSDTAQLVVRYDSEHDRINFLKYMPDTYQLDIKAGSSIVEHFDFIDKSISELIINGLRVDLIDVLITIRPVIIVKKKRERWRFVGMNGLKMIVSFDNCEYSSPLNPSNTEKRELMEVACENHPKQFEEIYNEQMKQLVREFPTIVKIQHSDLFIGYDSLLHALLKQPAEKPKDEDKQEK